jgi:hypothetical protein
MGNGYSNVGHDDLLWFEDEWVAAEFAHADLLSI